MELEHWLEYLVRIQECVMIESSSERRINWNLTLITILVVVDERLYQPVELRRSRFGALWMATDTDVRISNASHS